MKENVNYRVHYLKNTIMSDGEHKVIVDKYLKTVEEVKKFIKTLDSKDTLQSITKHTHERLDLKEFTE